MTGSGMMSSHIRKEDHVLDMGDSEDEHTEANIFPFRVLNTKQLKEQKDQARMDRQMKVKNWNVSKLALDRWIETKGNEAAIKPEDAFPARVYRTVVQCARSILKKVKEIDPRFECKLIDMGSFLEGVKTRGPDEFDFICELVELVQPALQLKSHKPRAYNSYGGGRVRTSYVEVAFRKDDGDWREFVDEKTSILDANLVRGRFKDLLKRAAEALNLGDTVEKEGLSVENNGPALTIFMTVRLPKNHPGFPGKGQQRQGKDGHYTVKFDLTLAILAGDIHSLTTSLPDLKLHPVALSEKCICHLISSSNSVWRVSFAVLESRKVKELPKSWKGLLVATKHLRDLVAYGSTIEATSVPSLSSYPIKVAVLKQHDRSVSANPTTEDVRDMLGELQEGEMTSFIIKDNPVFPEDDTSHHVVRTMISRLERDLSATYFRDFCKSLVHNATLQGKTALCMLVFLHEVHLFILCFVGLMLLFVAPITGTMSSLTYHLSCLIYFGCLALIFTFSFLLLLRKVILSRASALKRLFYRFLCITVFCLPLLFVLTILFALRLHRCGSNVPLPDWTDKYGKLWPLLNCSGQV